MHKVIDNDLEEGLVSGHISASGIMGKYWKVILNSLGAEIRDLTMPDVKTLFDAAQGGVNQHMRLTMLPARPSLADAMRIIDVPKYPVGAKFGGWMVNRRAMVPDVERCPV